MSSTLYGCFEQSRMNVRKISGQLTTEVEGSPMDWRHQFVALSSEGGNSGAQTLTVTSPVTPAKQRTIGKSGSVYFQQSSTFHKMSIHAHSKSNHSSLYSLAGVHQAVVEELLHQSVSHRGAAVCERRAHDGVAGVARPRVAVRLTRLKHGSHCTTIIAIAPLSFKYAGCLAFCSALSSRD